MSEKGHRQKNAWIVVLISNFALIVGVLSAPKTLEDLINWVEFQFDVPFNFVSLNDDEKLEAVSHCESSTGIVRIWIDAAGHERSLPCQSAVKYSVEKCDETASDPYDQQAKSKGNYLDRIPRSALVYCRFAGLALPFETRLRYQYGRAAESLSDVQLALENYKYAAELGYVAAQADYGRLLITTGKIKDGLSVLTVASNKSSPKAMFRLARIYIIGEGGVPQNINKGCDLLRRAANAGQLEAIQVLRQHNAC